MRTLRHLSTPLRAPPFDILARRSGTAFRHLSTPLRAPPFDISHAAQGTSLRQVLRQAEQAAQHAAQDAKKPLAELVEAKDEKIMLRI